MTNQRMAIEAKLELKRNILRRFLQVAISIILIAILLFVSTGKIDWIYAWVYIAVSILVIMINSFIFPPELIAERGRKKENVEKWDRIITKLGILPIFMLYIVAGLDIRFGWSPRLPLWIHIIGLLIFIGGNTVISWAMISNPYFSTAVRIQYDRGHIVSTGGPYKFIRHPGYLGMTIYNLATPVILGSIWALTMAGLTIVFYIIRTRFEDNTLKNKLEGYKEYAEKVRYRLIPGIW